MINRKLTQQELNEQFKSKIKPMWDLIVKESGLSEQMAIATGKGEIPSFLAHYVHAKQNVEQYGLVMPALVDGWSIN